MRLYQRFFLFCFVGLFSACATVPPQRIHNVCSIFSQKDEWFAEAWNASNKWGVPVTVLMAIMHQESKFRHDAVPPEKPYFLWIIPRGRISSAYGYSQAIDGTWEEYQKSTGNHGADRDDFGDSIDFIGWYIHRSTKQFKISKKNVYHHYLIYHEGPAGYSRRTYRRKRWLRQVAGKVARQERRYRSQFRRCKRSLASEL